MSGYGYDSNRRRTARRARRRAAVRRRVYAGALLTLIALAAVTIAYDHLAHPGALTPPAEQHPVSATAAP